MPSRHVPYHPTNRVPVIIIKFFSILQSSTCHIRDVNQPPLTVTINTVTNFLILLPSHYQTTVTCLERKDHMMSGTYKGTDFCCLHSSDAKTL